MMRSVTLFFLLVSYIAAPAQDASFVQAIQKIKANLFSVETGDENYEQEFEIAHTSVVRYRLIETDKKGSRTATVFEFNLADVDPYLIREETRRDAIYLNLTIENGQKFIKESVNEEAKGYESSIEIVARDIDNARRLKTLFKSMVPLAKEITRNKLDISNYQEMETWLIENIKPAEGSGKTYQQTISKEKHPGSFKFSQTEVGSKTEGKQYLFNLADLNENTLSFNISGSSLSLAVEAKRKQKIIQEFDEGQPDGFRQKISIYTNSVEEARDLKTVLSMAIPLAEEQVKASIPTFSETTKAMGQLKSLMLDISYDDDTFQQELSGECLLDYTLKVITPKTVEKKRYLFNLIDINPNLMEIDVTFNKMFVQLNTEGSQELIKYYKNGEHAGYENQLKLYPSNMEDARRQEATFVNLIELCSKQAVNPFESQGVDELIQWLKTNIDEVRVNEESIIQRFDRVDVNEPNKLRISKKTIGSKKSKDEIFEFSLVDINPKSLQFKVTGKELTVTFETNYKEDIIKYYKDGEIGVYQDGFELNAKDIEQARSIIRIFQQLIEQAGQ